LSLLLLLAPCYFCILATGFIAVDCSHAAGEFPVISGVSAVAGVPANNCWRPC
jgi:hypothetical protein